MLEKIREGSQGFWAIVILGLVILSFVFAGVGGYISSSTDAPAAKVNGEVITMQTLERAYQNERARMESQYGEAFSAMAADADYLKQFRDGVLDRLIADELIEQVAKGMDLRVSDAQVREAISAMPEFQIAGKFSRDRFDALLRQAGFQPHTFMDYMRDEMTRQQVIRALLGSEFATKNAAQTVFALQRQTRDIKYLTVSSDEFKNDVSVTEEELQAYYQDNLTQYDTEEQVSVEYVELKVADLMPNVDVSEEDALGFYEDNKNNYQTEEERRVSHILIEFGDDKEAAKEKAESLLAQLRDGADFEVLATENSEDLFSAENGGDLDWFVKGSFDPAFEDAAFSLTKGDISDVVESASGFHIIQLTDVKAQEVTAYDDVKEDIYATLKEEKAQEEFYNLQLRMEEVAFESPDSLEDVAAEVNSEVNSTALFSRNTAPQPIASQAALVSAFDPAIIEDAVNSDVIEVEEGHVLVLRVAEHKPERTKSFDEVKNTIETALLAEKVQEAAKAWADSVIVSLQNGEDVASKLEEKSLEWKTAEGVTRFGANVSPAIAETAFKLGAVSQPRDVALLNNGDVSIVELVDIHSATEPQPQELAGIQQQLQSAKSQQMMADLIESLKSDADIERF
ncbi:SurA N-terminal domain-containing protein [Aestuariibacter sp. AA17]|uniref:Periplasmic chaperone PpiD n=1 Tax=Fluctibacter corallii TaxID=2984329 RepID=A0ABT3A8M1_9ALTE|nr:SurA N-terminal domain-containing protein [Aestuariibacter sp. AA17]MCV2885038.1 SurA N-terminal domain-containing protein [Aestuariibacter sp. AA17]